MESTDFELSVVGDDIYDPLNNTGLFGPQELDQVVKRGAPLGSPVFSRHLTIYRGGTIVTTAEDCFAELTSASASLELMTKLHKMGVLKITSINGIQVPLRRTT